MMYEKQLKTPVFRRRSIRRKLSLFKEEENQISACGIHFLQQNGHILCAEGAVPIGQQEGTLVTSEGHEEVCFTFENPVLTSAEGEDVFPFFSCPDALFCFITKEGERKFYALCKEGLYELSRAHYTRVGTGGSCGAIHGERLFTADGYRLTFTAPLELTGQEEQTQGPGYVDLPSADGNILAIFSLGEQLFLFRERGIVRFGGKGDTLGFYADHVPFAGGEIRAGSVKKCGDRVCFLTRSGLYAFDGSRVKRLTGCGFSRLDLTGFRAAACGGTYFVTAKFEGEDCLWCVHGENGHLIRVHAEQLSGGKQLRFLSGGTLYALGERGLPPAGRRECALKTEHSLFGLSSRTKYLDGILIEGEGHFRVEARGERGLPRAVFGAAGEKLRFPLPVRGVGFTLGFRTMDETARLDRVILDLREEVLQW